MFRDMHSSNRIFIENIYIDVRYWYDTIDVGLVLLYIYMHYIDRVLLSQPLRVSERARCMCVLSRDSLIKNARALRL